MPKPYTVAVLQNEIADAAFLVYGGRLAVHTKPKRRASIEDRLELGEACVAEYFSKDLRDKLLRPRPIFKDEREYTTTSREVIGARYATIPRGHAFGEKGFDDDGSGRRSATVMSITPHCYLFKFSRQALLMPKPREDRLTSFAGAPHTDLVRILKKSAEKRTDDDVDLVLHHCSWQPFLTVLEPSLAKIVCRHLKLIEFRKDECVVLQGDMADCYYVIYHGQAEVWIAKENGKILNRWKGTELWTTSDDYRVLKRPTPPLKQLPLEFAGDKVFVLQQGMAFGENGLDPSDGPKRRNATIVARGGTLKLLQLSREDVRTIGAIQDTSIVPPIHLPNSSETVWTRARFKIILDRRKHLKKKKKRDSLDNSDSPRASASEGHPSPTATPRPPRSSLDSQRSSMDRRPSSGTVSPPARRKSLTTTPRRPHAVLPGKDPSPRRGSTSLVPSRSNS